LFYIAELVSLAVAHKSHTICDVR